MCGVTTAVDAPLVDMGPAETGSFHGRIAARICGVHVPILAAAVRILVFLFEFGRQLVELLQALGYRLHLFRGIQIFPSEIEDVIADVNQLPDVLLAGDKGLETGDFLVGGVAVPFRLAQGLLESVIAASADPAALPVGLAPLLFVR